MHQRGILRSRCSSGSAFSSVRSGRQIRVVLRNRSEIAQPPIVPTLLDAREPPAGRVEQKEHGNPNGVDRPQRESISGREKFARASHRGWRNKKKCVSPVTREAHPYADQMSEQHMSDVIKEWNSPEHDQGIGGREVKALEPTHKRERRA